MMKSWLLLTLVIGLSPMALGKSCDVGKIAQDAPQATHEFDFLLGNHEVTLHAWTGTTWTPPRPINAQWNGRYGLNGYAIYDEWTDPDPARASQGVNVRVFDADEGLWKMMWISTASMQVQDLRAKIIDGVLTMWQTYPVREGWKAEFKQLSEQRWQRIDYQQNEQGVWQPGFKLIATKRSCND